MKECYSQSVKDSAGASFQGITFHERIKIINKIILKISIIGMSGLLERSR